MDRTTLLLETAEITPEAWMRGYLSALNLTDAQGEQCTRTMLNVISLYDLETSEDVIQKTKRQLRAAVDAGKMSARKEAQTVALFRIITNAPDEAEKLADFLLGRLHSGPSDW